MLTSLNDCTGIQVVLFILIPLLEDKQGFFSQHLGKFSYREKQRPVPTK